MRVHGVGRAAAVQMSCHHHQRIGGPRAAACAVVEQPGEELPARGRVGVVEQRERARSAVDALPPAGPVLGQIVEQRGQQGALDGRAQIAALVEVQAHAHQRIAGVLARCRGAGPVPGDDGLPFPAAQMPREVLADDEPRDGFDVLLGGRARQLGADARRPALAVLLRCTLRQRQQPLEARRRQLPLALLAAPPAGDGEQPRQQPGEAQPVAGGLPGEPGHQPLQHLDHAGGVGRRIQRHRRGRARRRARRTGALRRPAVDAVDPGEGQTAGEPLLCGVQYGGLARPVPPGQQDDGQPAGVLLAHQPGTPPRPAGLQPGQPRQQLLQDRLASVQH
ncbi:hypothetical protein HLB32_05325 [Streptomyces cacaoi]|uniref:hypothetical protein n=1 Tax=Streptomyces cacaoi TaxID=1898 RepID=UPI0014798275|nr:hypothetical protein [Streptomyces cacaoi]NNG84351.1 hypothetical protein [Streptomyces cacaoi]